MVATRNKPAKPITARNELFVRLVVAGKTNGEAWKQAYAHPNSKDKTAAEAGSRMAAMPAVQARIQELQAQSARKSILSLDDRLSIMAQGAQDAEASWGERARCVEVYNKTAGDHAPDRQEVTVTGDPANPVVVASVTMTKAHKIAALAAQRRANA